MKKEWIKRLIYGMLIIATAVMIFKFSSQAGSKSQSISDKVLYKMIEILPIDNANKIKAYEKNKIVIRKIAHFSIYAILALWINLFLRTYSFYNIKYTYLAVFICFIYAITDEWHQFYVPGRDGNLKDVILDTCGSLTSSIIYVLIDSALYKKEINKELKKAREQIN